MQVKVRVFASLRRHVASLGENPISVELPEGNSVAELMRHLQIPLNEVKVMFVNGRARPEDWQLEAGDEVGIFPPVGGG
jgi:sulfur-carrier protein